MKPILFVPLLLASCLWADEATDRIAIIKTIFDAGAVRPDPASFTTDFPDSAELARSQGGAVVISKEPWGEATWLPGLGARRFTIRSLRFVTPEVVLVDATENQDGSVLFVMKKDGESWKIASFRRVAPSSIVAESGKTAP
jgi:hypothetical protein